MGLTPPSAKRRAHDREIAGAHIQRALPCVEIGRFLGVAVDPVEALQQAGNATVAEVCVRRRGVDLFIKRKRPTRETRQSIMDEPPSVFSGGARRQAGRRNGARIDHRVGPATAMLDGREGIEGQSSGVCAELVARLFRTDRFANQREHERLRHAHDREFVVGVSGRVDASACPDNADAEQIAGDPGERRIDLGVLAVGIRLEAPVRVRHQRPHRLGFGQVPCRDIRPFRLFRDRRQVHWTPPAGLSHPVHGSSGHSGEHQPLPDKPSAGLHQLFDGT